MMEDVSPRHLAPCAGDLLVEPGAALAERARGGVEEEVAFVEVEHDNDEIDAAYRAKYDRYPADYVNPMVGPDARAATLELVPRPTG